MSQRYAETLTFTSLSFKSLVFLAISILSSTVYSTGMVNHIDIHAGQRIGMHLIKQDPKLLPDRGPFRDAMSPLSLKHGIEHFSIGIEEVIKGDYAPNTIDIYLSWSDEKSNSVRKDIGSNSVIADFNKRATEVPAEVKGFNLIASNSSQIVFTPGKVQTVSYVWLSPTNGKDYARYESAMQATAQKLGVITQAKFETVNSDYHTYPSKGERAPDYVIFSEWRSPNNMKDYFNSKEYKEFGPYLESGTENILIMQLDTNSFYSSTENGFRMAPEKL